jgi:hypothetical protein
MAAVWMISNSSGPLRYGLETGKIVYFFMHHFSPGGANVSPNIIMADS